MTVNKLVVASNNLHKIKEIKAMLAAFNIEVLSLKDLNIDIDVEETGTSFMDNAFLKAQAIYDIIKIPVLSDDSGLEVNSLNNDPGIYSARYAGEQHNDEDNLNKLLLNLKNVNNRNARYVCAMVLMMDHDTKFEVEGYLYGKIIDKRKGQNGFGYDPIFYLDNLKKTVAELSDEEKNNISHRYNALIQIVDIIKDLNN
jgi:XTP/dITP diphosphohydrolase